MLWSSTFSALLLSVSPLLTNAAQLNGYQEKCKHDTSLTFDDGPYINTQSLVDTLNSNNAKATFYVNGNNWGCIYSEQNVASIRKAYLAGHTIASHSWSHQNIATLSNAQLAADCDKLETALVKILGVKPALFRPPYGSISAGNLQFLNDRGYVVVGWSKDTNDANGGPVQQAKDVMNGAVNLDLILSHETVATTPQIVVPQTLPGMIARGLRMVNTDVCLDINPYRGTRGAFGTRDSTWNCNNPPSIPGGGNPAPGPPPV